MVQKKWSQDHFPGICFDYNYKIILKKMKATGHAAFENKNCILGQIQKKLMLPNYLFQRNLRSCGGKVKEGSCSDS